MHVPPAQNSANLRLGNANRPRGNVNLGLRNVNLGLRNANLRLRNANLWPRNANLWLRNVNLSQRNVRLPSAHAGPPLLHVDVGPISAGERLTNIHPTRADAGDGWANVCPRSMPIPKPIAHLRQSDSERREIRDRDPPEIGKVYSREEMS